MHSVVERVDSRPKARPRAIQVELRAREPAPTTPDRTKLYFPAFDWLRGVLAISVMLTHDHVLRWEHGADFAVEVFFALSGFLIGGILLKTNREALPRFFFNRATRIWVPYYLALAVLVGVSLLRDAITLKWGEFVLYKLTFVYNLFGPPQLATAQSSMPLAGTGNHFWSVNAEEQFYLLAPLLLVAITPRLGRSILTWSLIAVLAWWYAIYASIVFGVLASVLVARFGSIHTTRLSTAALIATAVVSTGFIVADWHYAHVAPFAAISIVLCLARPGRMNPVGAIVGGMSYPLYLNHWIGVMVGNILLTPLGLRDTMWRHGLSAVVAIALAVALYWFIDQQLLKRRGGWYTSRRGVALMVIAYLVTTVGVVFGLMVGPMLLHR